MRLFELGDDGEIGLTDDKHDRDVPPYAILSHTWGDADQEVKLPDLLENRAKNKDGYRKIEFCRKQAARDGLRYFWVDSCCINQDSIPELTRAINSMFRWYRNSEKCYVYFSDVQSELTGRPSDLLTWEASFRRSRWFTRGWTLQELIAPRVVEFFSSEGHRLGDRESLEAQLTTITKIPVAALRGQALSEFAIEERMSWVATRETKVEEDRAYCLLGIFSVHLPLIYGEGEENAFRRLRREINDCRKQTREPFSTVPFSRDPKFVDRPSILAWMRDKCAGPASRAALVGIGGIGKSQVAIEYAYRLRDSLPQVWVFWVHASTKARFEEAYRGIAERLALQGRHKSNVNIFLLVSSWLCDENNGRWVMILDSVDNIEVFYPKRNSPDTSVPLANYLPQSQNGSILVTSRSKAVAARIVGELGALKEVCIMDEDQAFQLLHNRLHNVSTDDGLADLVRTLDRVPLAITQAAAYINQRFNMSVPGYLGELRKSNSRKLKLLSRDLGDLCRDSSASSSVVTTWQISFEQIFKEKQSAADLLSLASFFNPQGISDLILRKYSRTVVAKPEDDDPDGDFDDNLDLLQSYSLLTITTDNSVYQMHALVQFCTRAWLSALGRVKVWRRAFLGLMAEEFPKGDFKNWTKCQQLLPHIEPFCEEEPPTDESARDLVRVLTNAAWYMWQRGCYEAAQRAVEMALRAKEMSSCHDEISTLTTTAVLASVLRSQGKYEGAEKLNRWVVSGFEKQLGGEHRDTLTSRNNLVSVLRDQGKYKEAERIIREVLDKRQELHGNQHPDTLTSTSCLALILWDQGNYIEAESLSRLAFDQRSVTLGHQHPSTLTSASDLALILRDQGKYTEAEELSRQALAGKERELGKRHPHTLVSVINLALVLQDQGMFEQASTLYRQVLEVHEQDLGERHPETLTSAGNLATVLQDLGQFGEAELLIRRVLGGRLEQLGELHPLTISSLKSLALVLRDRGKYTEAEEVSREALKGSEEVWGWEHVDTLTSAGNLALVLQDQGKHNDAEEINRRVLKGYEASLGSRHPYTLASINNLALILQDQRRYGEAEELSREALEGRQKELGEQHPDTLASENNLAVVLRSQRRYEEAELRGRRALQGREKLLGKQHPGTLRSLGNLALILQDRGWYEIAEKMHREAFEGMVEALGPQHPDTLARGMDLASCENASSTKRRAS